MTVKLGDVETFHADLDETIAAQKADGTLVSYNYLPSTTRGTGPSCPTSSALG